MRGKLNKLIAIATVTCGIIPSFPEITHQHIRIGTQLLSPPPTFSHCLLQYSVGQPEREKNFGGKGGPGSWELLITDWLVMFELSPLTDS